MKYLPILSTLIILFFIGFTIYHGFIGIGVALAMVIIALLVSGTDDLYKLIHNQIRPKKDEKIK